MTGERSIGRSTRFTDLRMRLDAAGSELRAVLSTAPGDAVLAEGITAVDIPSLQEMARTTLVGSETERSRLLDLGRRLAEAGFPRSVAGRLASETLKNPIRVRISASGALGQLPWEAAVIEGFGTPNDGYLCLSPRVSVTRDVGDAKTSAFQPRSNPRVLVAWANPGSAAYPSLHFAEREAKSVIRALQSAECGTIEVEELPFATTSGLLRTLAKGRIDVLHFIGHADYAPTGGFLVLEGGLPGTEGLLYSEDLAQALVKAETSLVTLSGCLTSGSPAAIGTELAKAGVPAVLAMSLPILDAAAHQFARALYSSLAEGIQLEEAMCDGRSAIMGMGCDWVAPQLMLAGAEPIVLAKREGIQARREPSERKTNLSYDDRPFIGRTKERTDLRRKIRDQGQRLVTITGPGGMGKTRLSRQVAAELLDDFPDGVWFVDCEFLTGEGDLVAGIASTVPFCAGVNKKKELIDAVARRRALLVLDCFENSVAQGALLEDLLMEAPNLHILATSRIVLGVPREHEYPLPPMSTTARTGEMGDGISLFVEAAGHAIDGFEITAKNRKLLRELCGSLEGVPLSIVLAAGRLRHMSLSELIEQVRLEPLVTLRRQSGGLDRHSNIEGVVAGSFNLLPVADRRILRLLGLFVGKFTAADAAFVSDTPALDLRTKLSDLRDHSLVQVFRDEDMTRYKLLDTVRDYVSHLTVDHELDEELRHCRNRHAEYFAARAVEIGKKLADGRWAAGTAMLMQDLGNLRAAIDTLSGLRSDDMIADMVANLSRQYFEAGLLSDFRKLADAGYEVADRLDRQAIRIQLLGLEGALASRQGDEHACELLWTERVQLCRDEGDVENCLDALFDLAWQAFDNDEHQKARLRLIEALRMARSFGDLTFIATARVIQARFALKASNDRLLRRRLGQTESLLSRCQDNARVLFVYQNLSVCFRDQGDVKNGVTWASEVLRLAIERHQAIHAAWALTELAPLYEQTRRFELAARCYLAAMKIHVEYATKKRAMAVAAFNQFKKKHSDDAVSTTLSTLRNKPWLEIVEGIA